MGVNMSELAISLLGTFEVRLNNDPVHSFQTRTVQALLAYLVCAAKRPFRPGTVQAFPREQLMELLWPGMPLKSSQGSLRQTVYRLRQALPEVAGRNGEPVPFLLSDRQAIQINPEADYFADIHLFVSLIEHQPEKAIELYRGDFLAEFFLPDSETFEAWANAQRELYRRQVLEVMEQVTAVSIENGTYKKAIHLAQRQLEIDNLRESSHRQLMEAWARNGRRQEALMHYENLCQLLQEELAIEPGEETRNLIDAIRADTFASATTRQTRLTNSKRVQPKHNLPQRLTSFVGREKEIASITDLLNQHRLIMLTGVGGIGKTNLSLQVGRTLLDSFSDGVWLVELAALTDGELIAQTAVSTLNLPAPPTQPPLQTLLNYLQEKSCLLILDNCEHLINAAAQFGQTLLQTCPKLKILASSRERLGILGEVPFHVPPLSLPNASQELTLDEWQQYDALRLFVDRATAVLPDFHVTSTNLTPLLQICRHLDGIPLALELAATRVNLLTLAQIAERLDDRFRLLTEGSRTALPRQQTLRALIDWSWELLTVKEKLLFQRISVFVDGMGLEAVEAVCADDSLNAYDILDVLSKLVNKSLVIAQREQGEETRYYLLETIRQYAWEHLSITGQDIPFRQRHLEYFTQLSEKAEQALAGPDQVIWLNRLEKEWDNIRAALKWASEADIVKGLHLVANYRDLWFSRGNIGEGEGWAAQLLAHSENLAPTIRAKALYVQGAFNCNMVKLEHGRKLLEESLSFYQLLEDENGIAFCLQGLGYVTNLMDKRNLAYSYLSDSLALFRKLDDKLGLANTLRLLGDIFVNNLNQFDEAIVYLQESHLLYRELGHLQGINDVSRTLGQLALKQGDYDTARLYLEECLVYDQLLHQVAGGWLFVVLGELNYRLQAYEKAQDYLESAILISKESGVKNMQYWGQAFLGYCFLWWGKLMQARTFFIESQQQFKDVGQMNGVNFATEGLAILAVHGQQPEVATRLLAWTDASREAIQDPRPPSEQADVDRATQSILQMIEKETYAAAYAAGQLLTIEEVIALALTVAPPSPEQSSP